MPTYQLLAIRDTMNDEEERYPTRDNSNNLYVPKVTLNCAVIDQCIPCAYKVNCFDVALDKVFTSILPNARPDSCPRISSKKNNELSDAPKSFLYKPNMSILTIGDGDFTFSLSIARTLNKTGELFATSYESYDKLNRIYPNFYATITELSNFKNVTILYNVDATDIQKSASPLLNKTKFHRIIFNFPCSVHPEGQDGQNQHFTQNQLLISDFIQNSSALLHSDCGEIHVTHKTKPPYNQWNIETLCNKHPHNNNEEKNISQKMEYQGRIVFDKCCFLPYTPRKALDRKSFPCHDACIYIFGRKKKSQLQKKNKDFPPSIPSEDEETEKSVGVTPLTKDVLTLVRSKHLEYLSKRYKPLSTLSKVKKPPNKRKRSRFGSRKYENLMEE